MKFIKNFITKIQRKKFERNRKIVELISEFYLNKHTGKDYNECVKKANKEIDDIGFTNISFNGKVVKITVRRPGYLIGRRGENIDKLRKFLKYDICIEEEKLLGHLFKCGDYMEGYLK